MGHDQGLPSITGASAVAARDRLRSQRAEVARAVAAQEQRIDAAKAELEERRKAMEAELAAQRAAMEAQMAPLRQQLAQTAETMWTVDLYLGRDEELEQVRDGEPAPADAPITVRQRVLAADEESLALVDQGGVDARGMDAFLAWVGASEENMARVVPDDRCVVAVVPSRQSRDYGDPWANVAMAEANRRTHWLIRNGQRLWVMVTDLDAGDRLLPTRDEFVDFFYAADPFGRSTKRPLEPGSEAWLTAERAAGARRRHYMRLMLVLQGLVDRTEVFRPLPPGGVSLLDVASQDTGKVRVLNEIDLALTDGREPFRAWQRRLNARLRPGLRVVCAIGAAFGDLYQSGDAWTRGRHPRLSPPNASYPGSGEIQVLEEARDGGWVFRYQRTDSVERRNVPVPDRPGYVYPVQYGTPSKRASCRVMADDAWVLPYDLATVEDLRYYLGSRDDRRGYLDMVPVIRAALAAKESEQAAEAPFRALLADRIALAHPGADRARLDALLVDAVSRWKLGSRHHRALAAGDERDAKVAAAIEADVTAMLNTKTVDAAKVRTALATARAALGDDVLVLTARRDGAMHAYAAHTGTPHGVGDGWLREVSLGTSGKRAGRHRDWQAVPAAAWSRRTVLWSSPGWSEFEPAEPSRDLTGPELEEGISLVRDRLRELGAAAAVVAYQSRYGPYGAGRALTGFGLRADHDGMAGPERDEEAVSSVTRQVRAEPRRVRGRVEWTFRGDAARWGRFAGPGHAGEVAFGGSVPWVDADDRYAGDLTRARLVWHDPQTAAALAALIDEHRQAKAARRATSDKVWDRRRAALDALDGVWRRAREAELHARFVEDYGTDAEDLWQARRGKVRIPGTPEPLRDLVRRHWRLDDTSVSIADLAGRAGSADQVREEYGDLADQVVEAAAEGDRR